MKFRKSDLKDGDIVTYRNGDKRIVKNEDLTSKNGLVMSSLNYYENDLRNDNCADYDIVKVERPLEYEIVFKRKEEILDEAEKRYLRDVIRPFRKQVEYISKERLIRKECIRIGIKNDADTFLPWFKENAMYKNMKSNKIYTLEELRL